MHLRAGMRCRGTNTKLMQQRISPLEVGGRRQAICTGVRTPKRIVCDVDVSDQRKSMSRRSSPGGSPTARQLDPLHAARYKLVTPTVLVISCRPSRPLGVYCSGWLGMQTPWDPELLERPLDPSKGPTITRSIRTGKSISRHLNRAFRMWLKL